MLYKTGIVRLVAATLISFMFFETLSPTLALALTEGPLQAEFVGSSGGGSLVDPFTGAFSYSIPVLSVPGPNGVGYGLTLNYTNNTSPESEASWVGLGWSLNAGAINRIKRGYPDDYKNAPLKYWRHLRPNWTMGIELRGGVEALSREWNLGASMTSQYNNYTGYDEFYNLGASLFRGVVNGNVTFNEDGVELDGDFHPFRLLSNELPDFVGKGRTREERFAIGHVGRLLDAQPGLKAILRLSKFNPPARVTPHRGRFMTMGGAVEGDFLPNTGVEVGLTGVYSRVNPILETGENVYGYLYSNNVGGETEGMDYYVERDETYSDKDHLLPIPFSNADYFAVSGAGIGGTFRAHHRAHGHFRPTLAQGTMLVDHMNLDIHLAAGIGVGGVEGDGELQSTTKGWASANNQWLSFAKDPDDGEPVFFRFLGDRGGAILDVSDNATQIHPDNLNWHQSAVWHRVNDGERVGRGTYVGYNTNKEMLDKPVFGCTWDAGTSYRSFSRRQSVIEGQVDRRNPAIEEGIGEFSIVNSDGMTYVYGLPVYARDEVTVQYGLKGLASENLKHNFQAYGYVAPYQYRNNDYLEVIEASAPYATSFLLTEVVSPDYVDRTNNGPTPDDLGGYVIFNYEQVAGSFNKADPDKSSWYKWRTPYQGTSYSRNSFSDAHDDAGSISYGFKEIYYLESIETKTHKATFHTSPRQDGYDANHDEAEATQEASERGERGLNKLDRIELWSKGPNGDADKLLSTTNFEYDYSLCANMPNAESNGDKNHGKLTLKQVWFEYEGIVSARISPYEFEYAYKPSSYFAGKGDISTRYDDLIAHGDHFSTDEQNPEYSPFNVDAWGNYQLDGHLQYEKYRNWVEQNPVEQVFDPAAWQLKWIKLPSGGEIHVQYEQHDYRYVQHRDAMVMVPLAGRKSLEPQHADWHAYEVDLSAIGIELSGMTSIEQEAVENQLKKYFGDRNGGFSGDREYIYFRFLYGLLNCLNPQEGTNPDSRNVEYLSGYAAATDINIENDKLYIKLGNEDQNDKSIPDRICRDFYHGAREGIVEDPCANFMFRPIRMVGKSEEDDVAEAAYTILQNAGSVLSSPPPVCRDINYAYSYLRIPAFMDKKGGGVRVKRVLTYDPGLENEDIALYGTEYIYKTTDGRSSGVATNEPVGIREENGLVRLSTLAQGASPEIVSAKKMRQLEEPVGESLLPGASIGYSHVIARNIHGGKSGPGFTVYDFHTARDYPFDMRNAPNLGQAASTVGTAITSILTDRSEPYGDKSITLNATQGFRFVLNSMHGQVRSVAKYVGAIDPLNPHLDGATMVEQVAYEYYQPWETVPVINGPSVDDITQTYPGKTVEVVTESRELIDDASNSQLQGDLEAYLGFAIPFPFGSGSGSYEIEKSILRTHVTNKVIEYPAILKSVVATQDGITDRTDYVAFDPKSGAPLLIKKYDGYHGLTINGSPTPHDGTYYSVSIPAWQQYMQFGQMAATQGLILKSDNPADGSDGNGGLAFDKRFIRQPAGDEHYLMIRTVRPGASTKLLSSLTPGDLIEIYRGTSTVGLYHVGTIGAGKIELLPVSYSISNNYQELRDVTIEIIKTGRANRLNATAGGFSTYGTAPQGVEHPLQ